MIPQKPSHPMYDLGIPPKPITPPKEVVPLPSIESLEEMLNKGLGDVVKTIIEINKLPLQIDGAKIVSALKGTELHLSQFVTQDPTCLEIKSLCRKLADIPDEVLITGATGTGKEIIARSMIGDRAGSVVVANCAGLPENLIESELFGHVRGAFTGADSQKQGMFAVARDGVMFLDEIGEFPLAVQGKLLRAIQYKKIRKVGANVEEDISCKFVCATHRDLREMVRAGLFREDLYARISTFELHIPALTERLGDCPLIVEKLPNGKLLLEAMAKENIKFSEMDLSLNVRALQRAVKRYKVYGRVIC